MRTRNRAPLPVGTTPASRPVRHRWANGATALVQRTEAGTAAIELWIMAGTAAERPREHGGAHLLEHVLFKPEAASDGAGAGQSAAEQDLGTVLEALGGDVNAYTTHDEIVFHATVPPVSIGPAVDAMLRATVRPAFDPEQVRREVDVVLEEIGQDEDDPGVFVSQRLAEGVFGAHGYARPVLGTSTEVSGHRARMLTGLHRRLLVGANVVLVVAGPVDPRTVTAAARPYLATLPAGRAPRRRRADGSGTGPRVVVARRDVSECQVAIGSLAPAPNDPDAVAIEIAALVLGYGEASRLSTWRRETGLATDVHAAASMGRDAGVLTLHAHAPARRVVPAFDGLIAQLQRIASAPITDEELARARAVLVSDLVYRRETSAGQAHALGYFESLGGPEVEAEYYRRLESLDPAAIQRACARWLAAHRWRVAAVVPPRTSTARLRSLRSHVTTALARAERPARRPAPPESRHGLFVADLPNGVRVRVEVDRAVAMAAGWLSWPGGSRLEDARTAGAGSLIARLLPRGSASIDGDALAREIEGRAALLDGFSGHSSAGLHFECLAGDARHVLERALDCALAPTLLDAEFERERALELESLAAERDDFAKLAILTALAGLYGPKHPYHQRRRGTAASLRALDGAVLRDRWAQWYPPGRMVVAVCGDVDPEMVIETVRAAVPPGKAPPRRPQWPAARVAARPAAKVHRRTGRGRAQTHVAIAMPGLPIGDARMATLDLMSAVLGGATGRLFMALREREGLVYHASAGASQGVDAGHLMVVAATSPSKLARAQTAIDAELARMMDELVPSGELDRVRTGLLGQYAADFERRARIASAIAFDECFGLGARAWREYPARLARVRPRDVQKLARELMLPRRRAAVVIG